MNLRAVYMADLHAANTLPYARRAPSLGQSHPDLLRFITPSFLTSSFTDRLLDTLQVLVQMYDYVRENAIDRVFILGDLLDKRLIDAATLKAFMDVFVKLVDLAPNVQTTIIPGNHESHDASGSVYTVSALEGIRDNVVVWNQPMELDLRDECGVRLVGFPYKPDEVARDEVRRFRDEGCEDTVLLMHQSLVGGKVGQWVNPDGIMPDDIAGFAGVLSGHFHTPQSVGGALYLGAPMQHNFGDGGEQRGFWDITFHSDEHAMELIATPSSQFLTLDWREMAASPLGFNDRVGGEHYLEVVLTGTDAEIKSEKSAIQDFLREAELKGARLARFRPTRITEKKARVNMQLEGGKITWPSAICGYLDACDITGLNRVKLEQIATSALEVAQRE